ncbi:hypothetical protein niasHT_031357 [Heterodera trifolii]|uniref:Uncharacterized protein n=1 Tax=Heterodera trifolii TaxID=157864 RepID=A0ABD2IYR1_9BILA
MAEENPKWREAKEREEAAETMRRIYASQQRDHSLYIRDRAKFEIFDKLTFRGPWSADILRELHKLAYKGGEFENDVWVGKFRGEYGAYEPEGMNFSGVKRAKVKDGVEELVVDAMCVRMCSNPSTLRAPRASMTVPEEGGSEYEKEEANDDEHRKFFKLMRPTTDNGRNDG